MFPNGIIVCQSVILPESNEFKESSAPLRKNSNEFSDFLNSPNFHSILGKLRCKRSVMSTYS